jgi:catechol 2,3-dioxygenase-like lactoylglutathione lyase family enzyme
VEVLSGRIILAAVDLARSRHFYEQVLGLRVYREYGRQGVVTGLVFFLGGSYLELTSGGHDRSHADVSLWVQVPDAVAEERRIVAAGAAVRKPAERMPWGLVECWVDDPDGFRICLVEVPEDHPIRRRVE